MESSRRRTNPGAYVAHPHTYSNNGYEDHTGVDDAPKLLGTVLDSLPLGTDEENSRLLNLIDKLRECRVDEYIDLPQIIVVGDQSSGKSSVLEAITEIPFPRKNVRCTRFATQISLRRADEVKTRIRILPAKGRTAQETKGLLDFEEINHEQVDFNTVFSRATRTIFPSSGIETFLSRDILSIESSGPQRPHLTVVDLPGIIHSATMSQAESDVRAIRDLAREYMQKERSIILPIVSGAVDISNQIVLTEVKRVDPDGIRTLPIITKPDKAAPPDQEMEFITLASNKDERNKFRLGWHILRNRDKDEMDSTPEQRRMTEKRFFASTQWGAKLEPSQLGVAALLKRLSTQLIRHISAEAFKVQADIKRELGKCKAKIEELGECNETVEDMREELYILCKRSGQCTQAAVQGHGTNPTGIDNCPSPNDGGNNAWNLRSRIVKQNKSFAKYMETRGSACLVLGDEETDDEEKDDEETPSRNFSAEEGKKGAMPTMKRSQYIKTEVVPLLRDNAGMELSMDSNPLLVYRLFQSYSRKWPEVANNHIKNIHKICEEFLSEIMFAFWPTSIHNRIWSGFIQDVIGARFKQSLCEANKLKQDRMRTVTPYELQFESDFYEWKQTRQNNGFDAAELANEIYVEVLVKMLLLYESNLKTFISNIIVQAVERHLVAGLDIIFDESRVRHLSDNEVRELIEEDCQVRTERQELRAKEKALEQGFAICKQIARRQDLGPQGIPQDSNFAAHYDQAVPHSRPDLAATTGSSSS
ncbi:hypothetical protein JMJ35_004706 [Cladonia borealis]|uniref:Dynamin family protein n=1 Tax=Cladonia borealis TaxID=184061 RepID=A0AA39R304_9LECA|nr:hypothetical protein JMJ35_004706 [Cladonia borealis]